MSRFQAYQTSKSILRPSRFEQPFYSGKLTGALLGKNKLSQKTCDSLLIFENLPRKLSFLEGFPGGIRFELELKIQVAGLTQEEMGMRVAEIIAVLL